MKKIFIASLLTLLFAGQSVSDEETTAITVEKLNANMQSLGGKQVKISGEVVKINEAIMRRNFIHINDGTGKVIVTSPTDTAKVGDKVSAVGTVELNIDFGMGYKYDMLVQQATITKQ
jgi:uncharacterized protein YgiM (DUF1202 family)